MLFDLPLPDFRATLARIGRGPSNNLLAGVIGLVTVGTLAAPAVIHNIINNGGGGGPPPPVGSANIWVDQNGGTCTRSSPAVDYTTGNARSCGTLQAAYDAMQTGDLAYVQSGTYVAQALSGTKAAPGVVISGAPSSTVQIGVATSSSQSPTGIGLSATFVTLKNMYIPYFHAGGANETLDGIQGDTWDQDAGGSNLLVENGNFGPYNPPCSGSFALHDNVTINGGSGIVIQNNVFHDTSATGCPGGHMDCFQVAGTSGLIFEGNKVLNCYDNGIILTGDNNTTMSNITLENNWFGPTITGQFPVRWNNHLTCPNGKILYNTVIEQGNSGFSVDCTGSPTIFRGNIEDTTDGFNCGGSAMNGTISYNLGLNGSACPGTANAVAAGQTTSYLVNSPNGGAGYTTFDYHLKSTATLAIGHADPVNFPTLDIDCATRTSITDIGSDQRSAVGSCVATGGTVTAINSGMTASPSSVVADNASTSLITATLRDVNNNPVQGKTVTLAKSGGSSTIATVQGTTDTFGQATFTVKDGTAESTTYTATDTTDSITVTQTTTVSFTTPVSGQRFVSTSGTNTGTCVSAGSPCLTLNYAYGQASLGDTIVMTAGTYANQSISGGKTGSGVVTIQPASGTVTVPLLDVAGANHIKFVGLTTTRYGANASADDITWQNIDTGSIFIQNATNLKILGGDVGPWDANALGLGEDPEIGTSQSPQPNNILIDGTTFHDILNTSDPTAHADCLQFTSGQNVTIQNSKFFNCGNDADVYIRGDFGPVSNFTIQNNFFGASAGFFSLRLSGQTAPSPVCTNFLIQNNSGLRGTVNASGGTGDEMWGDCTAAGANGVKWIGNIIGSTFSGDCATSTGVGEVWNYNVSLAGTACTGTGNTVGAVNFVNPVNASGIDLHLTGALGNADNKVPTTQPFASVDIDGQTRPIGTNVDAGADER